MKLIFAAAWEMVIAEKTNHGGEPGYKAMLRSLGDLGVKLLRGITIINLDEPHPHTM